MGIREMVSALSAAKRMAERSEWSLSNLKIQKLLYLAHMFYMGRYGAPLINGRFEAWDYGPVHPELYQHVKVFGASPVRNIFHSTPDIPQGPETEIIDEAVDQLGKVPASRLVAITHRKNGAWDKSYRPGALGVGIPNNLILEEYRERVGAGETSG